MNIENETFKLIIIALVVILVVALLVAPRIIAALGANPDNIDFDIKVDDSCQIDINLSEFLKAIFNKPE